MQKILKEEIDTPEKGYIYLGYDDNSVGGINNGLWIKNDDGTAAFYILSGYGSEPTITSIFPLDSAYIGDTITINGSNFIPSQTHVTFDGVESINVNVLSLNQLTLTVPFVEGNVSIVVTTGYGNSSPFSYTVVYRNLASIITNINPSPASISTTVDIIGYNFVPGDTVAIFGGYPSVTNVYSSNLLTAIIPNMPTGQTQVFLQGTNGSSLPYTFFVINSTLPTFTGFNPSLGYIGDTIDIYGTNFSDGQIQVRFGSTQASTITFVSSSHLTSIISDGTPFGNTFIRVNDTSLSGFTVSGSTVGLIPTIISIDPSSASTGTTVTLSGTNFIDVLSISFSSVLATIISQDSTSCVVNISDNTIPGFNSVKVINKYGISDPFPFFVQSISGRPVITGFYPTSGYRSITTIQLSGTNFSSTNGNSVYYENILAYAPIQSSTYIRTSIPISAPTGSVDIKVVTSSGSYIRSGFTVLSSGSDPIIESISPIFGKAGDIIDIYGQNLSGGTISFGTYYPGVTDITDTIDNTHLQAYVPSMINAGENTIVNIYVITSGTTLYSPFEIYEPPVSRPIISLSDPDFDPKSGSTGTLISVYGSFFAKYYTDISLGIYSGDSYIFVVLENQSYISSNEVRGYIPDTHGYTGFSVIKVTTQAGSDQKSGFIII